MAPADEKKDYTKMRHEMGISSRYNKFRGEVEPEFANLEDASMKTRDS